MKYYTIDQIRNLSKRIKDPINENLRRYPSRRISVFLSHSHKDRDIIEDVLTFLLSMNIYIYVDWLDPNMPKVTSAETADRIKQKIKTLDKFVVLLTDNSKKSKWVPWELGYADGVKNYGDIAVLPILRNKYQILDGVEYMDLYPQIREGSNEVRTAPAVLPPYSISKKGVFLSEKWLTTKNIVY